MGENLELEGRLATRSTMQWNSREDGGFGPRDGAPSRRRPPTGPFGPQEVNVADQRSDPDSLLNWVAGAIRTRRQIPELGAGTWTVLASGDPAVLAHCCSTDDSHFIAVHNLTDEQRSVELALADAGSMCRVLESQGSTVDISAGAVTVDLPRYGTAWLQTADPLQGHSPGRSRT